MDISYILNQVAQGATFTLAPVDTLNPRCGYQTTLEGRRGKLQFAGDTVEGTLEKLEIELQQAE
jgi:hypothetical protein